MRAAQSPTVPPAAGDPRPRPAPLSFGPFAFDPKSRLLSREGREVPLPPRVLGVLEILLQRAGEVVGRQELIDTIWKDAFVTDTSLAEAVSVLRQTLGDDPQAPTFIQTLHRRGYRFVAPVASPSDAPPAAPVEDATSNQRLSPSIGRELLPWSAAAIFLCIAAAALWQLARSTAAEPAITTRFTVSAAPGTTFDADAPALAISRDGTLIAWSACDAERCRLYLRRLDRIDPVALPSAEGRAPFFSPDGRWLGFFADGRLMKIPLSGGAATAIADAPTPLGATWIGREIVFAGSPSGGLQRVSEDGGDARPLTRPKESAGEIRHTWPAAVPGTRAIVFTIDASLPRPGAGSPGYLAALSLDAVDRSGASSGWQTLLSGVSIARPASRDSIVFARDADLAAVGFDAAKLAIAGGSRGITTNVATARGRAQFAISDSGTLILAEDKDRAQSAVLTGGAVTHAWPFRDAALSPDGSHVAGVKVEDTYAEIWVADTERGAARRLIHTSANTAPVWSADSRNVYFAARADGSYEIWRRDAEGAAPAVRVLESRRHAFPLAASPDGTALAFRQTAERTRADIWLLPLGGGAPRPIVEGPFDEGEATFSPDSSMLAFESAESGRWEIYVQRLRDGRRILASTSGGQHPVWLRDGLYFQSEGRRVRVAIVDDDGELRVKDATPLAALDGDLLGVAPDGRLLLNRAGQSRVASAAVSLNWLRELRVLLGPPAQEPPR